MSKTFVAVLEERGVVSVKGPDAEKLLQGVITNDMALLGSQAAIHAGLLSPQGKILFDFLIVKTPDGFLLDVARDQAAALAKRFTMYKLRAAVVIADVSGDYTVTAIRGAGKVSEPNEGSVRFADPRMAGLGWRDLLLHPEHLRGQRPFIVRREPWLAYHAHRIALGVPEGGKDYAFGDTFPHEALFDRLNGVSFTKGCYVGQEVVSRMEHRGTARKRVVPVVADRPLPESGTEVRAGDQLIGVLGSTDGARGLALLRLDRAREMEAAGHALVAGEVGVRIELPDWLKLGASEDHVS